MTVAAVIVAGSAEEALADVAGRPAARRLAECAWAGGALPIVVVSEERDGMVAASLAGSGAVLAEPPPHGGMVAHGGTGPASRPSAAARPGRAPGPGAVLAAARRGIRVADDLVGETDAFLVWPAAMAWVDPETVTTLIQAHGIGPADPLRPAWRGTGGWPLLVPRSLIDALARMGDADLLDLPARIARAGVTVRLVELGDPGAVHDRTTPQQALPPWEGALEPVQQPPEWGAAAADGSDDAPPEPPPTAQWRADEGGT